MLGRGYVTSSHPRTQQVTLLEGSAFLRGHDHLAPEPVLPPQDAHLLNGHSLGLRQEEDDVDGHAEDPEGEEDVCAILHPASIVKHPNQNRSQKACRQEAETPTLQSTGRLNAISPKVLFCPQIQAGATSVISSCTCVC